MVSWFVSEQCIGAKIWPGETVAVTNARANIETREDATRLGGHRHYVQRERRYMRCEFNETGRVIVDVLPGLRNQDVGIPVE